MLPLTSLHPHLASGEARVPSPKRSREYTLVSGVPRGRHRSNGGGPSQEEIRCINVLHTFASPRGKISQKDQRLPSPRSNGEDSRNHASKAEKLSMKKKGIGSEARAEHMAKADTDLQLLSHAEQERQLQKQKKRRHHGREEDTLAKLEKFKKSISSKLSAPSPSGGDFKGNNEDESEWMATRLTFIPSSSEKDDMTRKEDPNQYVVLDPLLEKGKEKFNQTQAKLKRRDREWAGKSLT